MRRTIAIGLLLGGILATGCQGSSDTHTVPPVTPDPGPSGPPPSSPVSANLTVVDPSGSTGPFAVDDLEKLQVSVDYANLRPGRHRIRVAVKSPTGSVYAHIPAELTVGDDRAAHLTRSLQVRGSAIEQFRQTGTWQLDATADGAPVASTSFELTE